MKLKLGIFTAVATIACTGLPVQASELAYKQRMIGFLAAAQCFVSSGQGTQEAADQITRDLLNDYPYLLPAYEWVETSPNGKAATYLLIARKLLFLMTSWKKS